MKFLVSARGLLLALGCAMLAPMAIAQDVVVVDNVKVLRESAAGQDMNTKLRTIRETIGRELEPEARALETEQTAIQAKTQGKTREQVQADTALLQQGQSFTRRAQAYSEKEAKRAREFQATERNALVDYNNKLGVALEAVRVAKNAKVMLDTSQILISDPSIDVTQDVITSLNASAPTITVTRVTLPDQPAAPQQ